MSPDRPVLKPALRPFGESIFTPITRMAIAADALNLGQGFPDFDGPPFVIDAAVEAMRAGHNQYAPSHGVPRLRTAIRDAFASRYGVDYDADAEVTVFSGATEALFSTINALVDAGDEIVILEPFYDSYPACVAMAGGRARYVSLDYPDFALDVAALEAAVTRRTKAILLNTPMNPSGKVFTRDELAAIADIACRHDVLVISDEVYEQLTFGDAEHVPIATLPGMRDRTLTISSTGKTFSMTGWKIGWAIGAPPLSAAVRAAHQFVTFCSATPLQHAMAAALERADDYYPRFRADYAARREALLGVLDAAGFEVAPPDGTYFALADITPFGFDDDRAFCEHMIESVGVAAIPPSWFWADRRGGRTLMRFAFCKRVEVLEEAGRRLAGLRDACDPGSRRDR